VFVVRSQLEAIKLQEKLISQEAEEEKRAREQREQRHSATAEMLRSWSSNTSSSGLLLSHATAARGDVSAVADLRKQLEVGSMLQTDGTVVPASLTRISIHGRFGMRNPLGRASYGYADRGAAHGARRRARNPDSGLSGREGA